MLLKPLLEQALQLAPADAWPTFDGKVLDRKEFLTSSQVASCLRQAFFEKHADSFPHEGFRGNGFTERGHAIEAWLVSKLQYLQISGFKFYYLGKDQRSFYDADLGLSGTPDGIMEFPNGVRVLLEFKSYDPRSNVSNFPRNKHKFQIQQNMYLVNKCLGWEIKLGIIWYINASDVFESYEFEIEYDEKTVELCKRRAASLWEAEAPDDCDAEGLITGDCEYCPAYRHCSAHIGVRRMMEVAGEGSGNFLLPQVGELELSDVDVLDIDRFLILRDESKDAEKLLETIKTRVKVLLKRIGGGIVYNGLALTYTEHPGRETIDKAALIKDGIEVEKYTKVGRPYGQLDVGKPKR